MKDPYHFINIAKDKESLPQWDHKIIVADFPGRPPLDFYLPEIHWDALASYYGLREGDVQGTWQEQRLHITNLDDLKDGKAKKIQSGWVTSYDLRAMMRGFFFSKSSEKVLLGCGVCGIVTTSDNQIVLGVRGGLDTPERREKMGVGLYSTVPAGGIKFKEKYQADPISDTVIEEFQEEIGPFLFTTPSYLGMLESFRPGPEGISMIVHLKTKASLKEIQELNNRANDFYNAAIIKGLLHDQAAKELSKYGYPPDAWEHISFIGIADDIPTITKWVETKKEHFCGFALGALVLYLSLKQLPGKER